MTVVIIAEKPSVADDIAKVLGAQKKADDAWVGDGLAVTWAIGHLVEQKFPEDYDPEFKNWRKTIDRLPIVPEPFEYKAKGGRNRKVLSAIKKRITAKDVTEIVNACDAAREGELIFRSIIEHTGAKAPTSRMWLQSMTAGAITTAWEGRQPSATYDNLGAAARSRSEADWIIGMNGSRVGNTFLKGRRERTTISLGRVQTATLAMIADEEERILSYVPEPFWNVTADVQSDGGSWSAKWVRRDHKADENRPEYKANRILDLEEKNLVEADIAGATNVTVTVQERPKHERPPLNFDLTSLQRRANSLWSWPSRRTLSVAQDLYDRYKVTTYPRTDSQYLPTDMTGKVDETIATLADIKEYKEHIARLNEEGLRNTARNFNDAKVSDHYAIVPTGVLPQEALPADHAKLFDLIARRFLASWSDRSTWNVETRTATAGTQDFVKSVEHLVDPGFRHIETKNASLPDGWGNVKDGAEATLDDVTFHEEMSKPPNRLKEARLLSLMEHAGRQVEDDEFSEALKDTGLGTPATRAETIEKLIDRNYIRRARNGQLSATAIGMRLIDMLRRIGVDWIASPELTGEMEHRLLQVQRGHIERTAYMSDIVERTTTMVHRIKDHDRSILYADDEDLGPCPSCGESVRETTLAYQCVANLGAEEGCSFIFWKDTSGRWFDRDTASRLIQHTTLEDLHGFFSRTGEEYTATVTLSDAGKVTSKGNGAGSVEATDEPIATCPVCESGTIRQGHDGYACDAEECSFRGIRAEMCQRLITPDEARAILTEGRSALLEGFVSRRGRPFSAYLVLNGKKIEYDFPPRQAAADATKFEVTPGVVAVCPKTNVAIVETPTHYQPEEAGSGCKIQIAREISKRELTREEAATLITEGQVGPFSDLISKKGNPFTAILYLNKAQAVRYRFAKRE
ncbi:MAG: DNA topoisomerase [Candidatus Poseidoniaceae archaeon]